MGLLLLYPFFVHGALVLEQPHWVVGSCVVLLVLGYIALIGNRAALWVMVLGTGTLVLFAGVWRTGLEHVMYLPPIFINLALLTLFGRTLGSGKTPLVTQFETLMNGEPDHELRHYTRRATQWWTAFFVLMMFECIGLALFAPAEIWSLFTNFLNYAAIALMFLIEYRIRVRALPRRTHRGFIAFFRKLIVAAPRAR